MSTYLVAFTVSDFESLTFGNLSIWARPNAIHQAKYARDLSLDALLYLSRLFKQGYHIPKMDMVAVPDFSAGAMENWGLITYREMRLLCDSSTSDYANQSVATVIVHELTHEWFGNMITPEWWSYLWLSEAFARYFQYFGTAQVIMIFLSLGHCPGNSTPVAPSFFRLKRHGTWRNSSLWNSIRPPTLRTGWNRLSR